MSNFDATTPQLKLVEGSFPKIADRPDETKEKHFERYGTLLSLLAKLEIIVHEVIEAPGKVVIHIRPPEYDRYIASTATSMCFTVNGTDIDYDTLTILTLVKENGEPKISEFKDFSNPEKRR